MVLREGKALLYDIKLILGLKSDYLNGNVLKYIGLNSSNSLGRR